MKDQKNKENQTSIVPIKKDIKNKKRKKNDKNDAIQTFKKNWLLDGTRTILLVLIIIIIMMGINVFVQNLELIPIDLTQQGLYSLSEESEEKISSNEKDVQIYFVGYYEDSTIVDLAKQYTKVNEKIVVEVVDMTTRPDLVQKYGIEEGLTGIIIESGEKSKVLTEYDLITYDAITGEQISIAEEVFTSSIISVSTDDVPQVYFLEGYSKFDLSSNLYLLGMYMTNEINDVLTVNPLSEGIIPEECDVLVIMTPEKDFDDITTQAITEYINKGGNILWFNSAIVEKIEYTNVNKILELYGIDPFEYGIIRETNSDNMVSGLPDVIFPETYSSNITRNSPEIVMVNATKININDEKVIEQGITQNILLKTSEGTYFRTDLTEESDGASENEEQGSFIVGVEMIKTIENQEIIENTEKIESKLIIYSENYFVTDYTIMQNSQYPGIELSYNKNLILDSIAYLGEREDDIISRKGTGAVIIYSPTETQDLIIKIIIFMVPTLIIVTGFIVWQIRKRK